MDESDPARDALHAAIQQHARTADDGAVLTGWVLVAEWMTPDGERWLTRGHNATLAGWTANGMLHEALHGDWPADDE